MFLHDSILEPVRRPAARAAAGAAMLSAGLIDAARGGDRAAIAQLLRELQDCWYRLSLSMLRDADLAADAVQETGLRFIRQIRSFRGDSQLRTWSLGIAINVIREMKRRRARHVGGVGGADTGIAELLDDPAPPPGASSEFDEARDALRRTLSDLPDRQREAIVLRYFEDLSVEETARLMGCAAGTVKATVHQALRSLRKRLMQLA